MLNLNRFPRDVRRAFGLMLAGWAGHFVFIYLVFVVGSETPDNKIVYQQVAIAAILGYFLYHGKKWARVLCLLCNSLVIILYFFFLALFWASRTPIALLSLGTLGCFAGATYFLITRESRAFYAGPVEESGTGGGGES